MTIENKLKDYILSQYKSIREFCMMNDFAYSTVDNIFRRGILGSSVSIVIRICDRLGIDVDELVNGNIVVKTSAPAKQSDIAAAAESLNEDGKAKVLSYIRDLKDSGRYTGTANIPQDIKDTLNMSVSTRTPIK
jgi:predicted TIM-barrel enzyme